MATSKIVPVLSVVVTYANGTSAKAKTATTISVRVGGIEVATKTVGGRWSKDQAMREWERNRKTFTLNEMAEPLLRLAA